MHERDPYSNAVMPFTRIVQSSTIAPQAAIRSIPPKGASLEYDLSCIHAPAYIDPENNRVPTAQPAATGTGRRRAGTPATSMAAWIS